MSREDQALELVKALKELRPIHRFAFNKQLSYATLETKSLEELRSALIDINQVLTEYL